MKTNITQYDFPTLMRGGDYDLGMCGSAGGIDPTEPLAWLNNEGTTNFPCIQGSEYVNLFAKASSILDVKEQEDAYVEVWQYILDDSAVCYLYSSNALVANNKRGVGVDYDTAMQLNWCAWTWTVNE